MCYQTSARDPAVSWAAWAHVESCCHGLSRGKGRGRGKMITYLQNKLQEGFALDGLPIEARGRWWDEVFMCAQLSQPVAHSLVEQVSLESPLRAFVKSWGSFPPHFYLLTKTKKPRDLLETIWKKWCQPLLLKCKAKDLKANLLLRASSTF